MTLYIHFVLFLMYLHCTIALQNDIDTYHLLLTESRCPFLLGRKDQHANLCLDSLPLKSDGFKCQPSHFQCLTSFEQQNCHSISHDCSVQYCLDGSDVAFCNLKSRFWNLSQLPTSLDDKSQFYLNIELFSMPMAIQQWLLDSNSSLRYTVLIYRTIGNHVTDLVESIGPSSYPTSPITASFVGPVRHSITNMTAQPHGYAITVDLSVVSSPKNIAVDISPSLTRRFALALKPPQMIDRQLKLVRLAVFRSVRNQTANATEPGHSRALSEVRVQIEAINSGPSDASFQFNWRCPGNPAATAAGSLNLSLQKQSRMLQATAPMYFHDEIVSLSVVATVSSEFNASDCKFWTNMIDSKTVEVSDLVPQFSVDLDFFYGLRPTADGGLDADWRVPEPWSAGYPPADYNFTIDYWPHLCAKGGGSLTGLKQAWAKLNADALNPDTRYWVSVRACNRHGCGPRSGYATGLTVGAPVPAVDLVSASLSNGTDLLVSWKIGPVSQKWPSEKRWLVSLYYDTDLLNLVCSDTLATDTTVEQSYSSKVLLDHLQGCSLYAMRVQVTDSAGYGPASPIYLQATGLSSTSPPKNVRYSYPYGGNSTQALVIWNAPCVIVFTPVAYVLKVTDMFTEDTREFFIDATADSVVSQLVEELESGRLYRLMVFANTVGGKSSVPVVLQTDSFVGLHSLSAQLASGPSGVGCSSSGGSSSNSSNGNKLANSSNCRISVAIQWTTDLPSPRVQLAKRIRAQFEVYAKPAVSSDHSVGSLWYRYADLDSTEQFSKNRIVNIVANPCVSVCPPSSVSYEIRTRVLLAVSNNDEDWTEIAGAFSKPVLLRLDSALPPMTPISCDGPSVAGNNAGILRIGLATAGSAILATLLLVAFVIAIRRRIRRRRWLRRSQLLLAEAYDDASGNLFPEHVVSVVPAK